MPIKFGKIEPDTIIVERKLSAIVSDIEELLKPFQHSLKTEIEKRNGILDTIRLTADIKLR